jgi:hypothetical protein
MDFINALQIQPRHVSANGWHLQGVVGALQATRAVSVFGRIRIMTRLVRQPFAKTCRGRIWNALIKSTTSLSICWSFYNDITRCSVQYQDGIFVFYESLLRKFKYN